MNKPKSKLLAEPASVARPRLGCQVTVRVPYLPKPTVGFVICLFEDNTSEVAVQVFPFGRDSLQIPAIPYFDVEPEPGVRSAAWPT